MRINKRKLSELLIRYETDDIERHLIFAYLNQNSIDFISSDILLSYFDNFEKKQSISSEIRFLDISSLKLLENYLELIIPKSDRKINGAFFTPTYIVNFIINEIQPLEKDKCLDPSCGSGAFLIGLLEYYQREFKKGIRETIVENIYGSDILAYNVKRAKLILSIYALQYGVILDDCDFNIYHQDSLKTEWKDKFEVIVGNPPYVKFQDLSDKNRKHLTTHWQSIENGTFNLYFAFFELGYNILTKNGRLGYITPNSYFTSLAGLSLRKYFSSKKCLTRIVDFRHKKVFDAQTYTAISFLNKKENESILYDKIKDEQSCNDFLINANGSPNYIKNLNVKKWRLLKSEEQENIRIIETIGTPIAELFNIAVGIATLKDEVFFIDGKNEEDGFFKKVTEKGVFYIEKEITKSVYKISNFKSQKEIDSNTLRIITPYKVNRKTASPILESEFQSKYPKCYEFLLSEREKLASRDKGKKAFEPFYVWGRTQGISRKGMKILTPTFSKHPRFLFVPEEEAYYTNGYGIYFSKDISKETTLFDDLAHSMSKEENILVVQKILNSVVMDYYVTATSVSLQGGFPCYQKNFIERFTIPEFTQEEIAILNSFSDKEEIDAFLIEKYQLKIPVPNLVL